MHIISSKVPHLIPFPAVSMTPGSCRASRRRTSCRGAVAGHLTTGQNVVFVVRNQVVICVMINLEVSLSINHSDAIYELWEIIKKEV